MIINLTSQKEGTWFPFFYSKIDSSTGDITYSDPVEGGPRMKIRNPVPFFKERAEAKKKISEFVLNKKTRGMEKITSDVELTPEQRKQESDDFADYVINGIENFKFDGKIVKCNRTTKIEMMELPIVSMYVQRCIEILQENSATEEKEAQKNS
jgi:hypothetical protein